MRDNLRTRFFRKCRGGGHVVEVPMRQDDCVNDPLSYRRTYALGLRTRVYDYHVGCLGVLAYEVAILDEARGYGYL
jgi:hypothetical protein